MGVPVLNYVRAGRSSQCKANVLNEDKEASDWAMWLGGYSLSTGRVPGGGLSRGWGW